MGSLSSSEPGPSTFRKGTWSKEEDDRLRKCIEMYGEGKWSSVPKSAGLKRCRKSCRLRWLNYLSPGIRRGKFADDEIDLIIRLHKLLGNRWSLIAGRIPGRTANGIKNFWNSHLSKKLNDQHEMIKVKEAIDAKVDVPMHIVKPQPLRLTSSNFEQDNNIIKNNEVNEHEEQWWNMNGSISGENQDKEVRLQETENIAPMSLQNYKFLSETEELLFQEIIDEDLFLGGVSEWEKLLQGGVCID